MVWHLNSWDYKITLSQGIATLRQIGVKKRKEGEMGNSLGACFGCA
jgi:hypothetical protein